MDNIIKCIPHILEKEDVKRATARKPTIEISNSLTGSERMLKLLSVYDLIIPTEMSVEIYYTLYFALVRSLQCKNKLLEKKAMNHPREYAKGHNGCDVGLITGAAGLGKSLIIKRCSEVIDENKVIELKETHCKIIPFLYIEMSPTLSMKGLLLTILNAIDEKIGTNLFKINSKVSTYLDDLMIQTAKALMLHVAVLIVDESDRFTSNKKSTTAINFITELINISQVSVVFVGTELTKNFFGLNPYIARRSFGNTFKAFEYDETFLSFLNELFEYQFTSKRKELTSSIARLLHKLSGGLPATLVYLFVEAQKGAIQLNRDTLDESTINSAFSNKMSLYEPFLEYQETSFKSTSNECVSEDVVISKIARDDCSYIFKDTFKKTGKNVDAFIKELQKDIKVEIVRL